LQRIALYKSITIKSNIYIYIYIKHNSRHTNGFEINVFLVKVIGHLSEEIESSLWDNTRMQMHVCGCLQVSINIWREGKSIHGEFLAKILFLLI
jgi:hypothetical protein